MTAQRLRRAAALVALTVFTAAGCVMVHGEDALVPSIDKAGAAQVLADFNTKNNQANKDLDTALNGQIETGVLAGIDQATLKVKSAKQPNGNKGYHPLKLTNTRFLIPQLRGWPKWFIADTANNRDKNRWLIAFNRYSASDPWKASYLLVLEPDELPDFAFDEQGHAKAVSVDDKGLSITPGDLSAQYAAYLSDGKSRAFADGEYTNKLRALREKQKHTAQYVTQYVDQPAASDSPPIALRTTDGGALVLFASRHTWKVTVAQGIPLQVTDAYIETLMSGTPKRSVTTTRVAEQAALAPKGAGKISILNRIEGIIAAHGQ